MLGRRRAQGAEEKSHKQSTLLVLREMFSLSQIRAVLELGGTRRYVFLLGGQDASENYPHPKIQKSGAMSKD